MNGQDLFIDVLFIQWFVASLKLKLLREIPDTGLETYNNNKWVNYSVKLTQNSCQSHFTVNRMNLTCGNLKT